ncbi:MAG: sterol desaturase family protein [Epsilonproteobacteria bacterium]|nr:MAG: sterol desaturase family protein [Campylobacterota bacterium]RLA65802.1 MAG: sterol desaturase family protein [Campylobacterota bacterium]
MELNNETILRLSFFFGIFGIVALWEIIFPKRPLTQSKWIRWYSNLGIVFFNSIVLRLVFSTTAVGFAYLVKENSLGLFNQYNVSTNVALIASVILLDLAIYLQHVMFHAVPTLWKLHRMHHTDLDYDVTTGARFHPIEIVLSMIIKLSIIFLLGVPPLAVVIFEILLNATAMFNHGNIYIPPQIDKYLRLFIVTPDMHRVHHSVYINETNSNFGFNLPWWDRLLGTYLKEPKDGQLKMTIGIDLFRKSKYLNIYWMLIQPFLKGKDSYAINHKEKVT